MLSSAEDVNKCRSLCKDFWRDVFLLLDRCDDVGDRKLKTWSSRHVRFSQQVQRLDGTDDFVYQAHPKFNLQ